MSSESVTAFCTVFCALGLHMLLSTKPVTFGSVLLLSCIAAAAAVAWTGGAPAWLEQRAVAWVNASVANGVLRSVRAALASEGEAEVEAEGWS